MERALPEHDDMGMLNSPHGTQRSTEEMRRLLQGPAGRRPVQLEVIADPDIATMTATSTQLGHTITTSLSDGLKIVFIAALTPAATLVITGL